MKFEISAPGSLLKEICRLVRQSLLFFLFFFLLFFFCGGGGGEGGARERESLPNIFRSSF